MQAPFFYAAFLLLVLPLGLSETIVRELNISRTTSDSGKQLISLNGEINSLGPTIRVQAGDTLNLLVNNEICDEQDLAQYGEDYCNTSIHFHGLVLGNDDGKLGALNDGVPQVTQRSIPPQMSYWYNFTIPESMEGGTYWFHSHSSVQYGDGLRGVFLVDSSARETYLSRVIAKLDAVGTGGTLLEGLPETGSQKSIQEVIVAVSDWYSKSSVEILADVMSPTGGPDPRVEGSTLNGDQDSVKFEITENTEYVELRVINVGMSGTNILNIEGHRLCVVETDGVLTKPYLIDTLSIAVGQRFTVLVKLDLSTPRARIIHGCGKMMGYVTKTHWLVRPGKEIGQNFGGDPRNLPGLDKNEKFREFVPMHGELLPSPRQQVSLDYSYESDFKEQFKTGMYAVNGDTMPEFLPDGVLLEGARGVREPIQLESDEVIEIAINSIDHMTHPWHMHGHTFQVISVGQSRDGPLHFEDLETPAMKRYQADLFAWEGKVPMTRDTINIPGSSYAVIRFLANNPGFWLLHCHVEWHMSKGLGVVLAEGNAKIAAVPNAFQRPDDYRTISGAADTGTAETDSSDSKVEPKPIPTSKWKVLIIYMLVMCLFNAVVWLFFFR
ncbi:LANO_0G01508g1_1 [Lachancea nothofagi CBS 11611]|uniref:LANO_0G01508g1_1 n=1 Tax=Lachancea nothofagi CBS 11611 TaxID=1266666 RepID=A0A1G4KEN4_9SACH|nr:LANO_0G01508g1_1 [Lachancea nothofagi CBS 11611]